MIALPAKTNRRNQANFGEIVISGFHLLQMVSWVGWICTGNSLCGTVLLRSIYCFPITLFLYSVSTDEAGLNKSLSFFFQLAMDAILLGSLLFLGPPFSL